MRGAVLFSQCCFYMFEAYGLSDAGCARTNNEDYFVSDVPSGIFILADGMGGANAGEYAARIGSERLYEYLRAANGAHSLETLEQGFGEANCAVRKLAQTNTALEGMGTTLLAARRIGPNQIQIGSVGDSRAYLFSSGQLVLLTQDQTWTAEVGSRLGLTDEALRAHPMRHVLTMAVGPSEELRVQSTVALLHPGDQMLLCSDGLHGVVDEKIFTSALLSEKSLRDKCHYLVEAAKLNGGPDNITVVLIRLG